MPTLSALIDIWPLLAASLLVGYAFGSIPFGLILTRLTGAGDLRSIGSGNIGATNVLRTGRKGLAALTLLLDALKGAVPVLLVDAASGTYPALAAGFGAFLGHIFPVWLRFKGGKGVATYAGVLAAVAWQGFLAFAVTWIGSALLFRYSSLAALIAAVVTPALLWYLNLDGPALLFTVMSVIVFIKHRENISRLLSKTESKIGSKG